MAMTTTTCTSSLRRLSAWIFDNFPELFQIASSVIYELGSNLHFFLTDIMIQHLLKYTEKLRAHSAHCSWFNFHGHGMMDVAAKLAVKPLVVVVSLAAAKLSSKFLKEDWASKFQPQLEKIDAAINALRTKELKAAQTHYDLARFDTRTFDQHVYWLN